MTSACGWGCGLGFFPTPEDEFALYIAETESPPWAIGDWMMLMLLPKCQSSSHRLHCYTLLWAIGPSAFPLGFYVKGTQTLLGSFPSNHFPVRQAFSLCRGGSSPGEYCRYSQGQQEERKNRSFIILSISIPSLLSFSLAQLWFIPGLGNQATRLQGVKRLA